MHAGLARLPHADALPRAPAPPGPGVRYRAERADYHRAVRTGQTFGSQHGKMSGRPLTYWRWVRRGIDNATGVITIPKTGSLPSLRSTGARSATSTGAASSTVRRLNTLVLGDTS